MDENKANKKAELLMENVVFIIITILFFVMVFLFLNNKSNDVYLIEEINAKKIALIIDAAKPDTQIVLDVDEVFKKNKLNVNPIDIDNAGNTVRIKMSEKTGYVYSFFNELNVDYKFIDQDGRQYIILTVN